MSLLFIDSFDHYATADITSKWTALADQSGQTTAIVNEGRNSTNCIKFGPGKYGSGTSAPDVLAIAPYRAANTASGVCGFACKPTNLGGITGGNGWFSVQCGSATHFHLVLQTSGTVVAWNQNEFGGGVADQLGTSTGPVLQDNVWTFVEVRWVISETVGEIQVWSNNVQVLNLTNKYTAHKTGGSWGYPERVWTGIQFHRHRSINGGAYGSVDFGGGANSWLSYDDFYLLDLEGSAPLNARLGDHTISALYPSGVGNTTGWTPSTGSNYACVDETSPNSDTDYVQTTAVNTKDTYAWQDVASGAEIKAVQMLAFIRKADEGPGQFKFVTRSGGADYDGGAISVGTTTYAYSREISTTDPATGVAWTESGFNAAEFGVKKTA